MKLIAILVCKLTALLLGLCGRGSSKPGQLALKLCPDILKRLTLPKTVIAVTGSNGKTSTVELIVKIFTDAGKTVCWNREGSNQIEGVTAMLIKDATLGGRVKSDAVVLETDEQYARHTFKYLKPTHFVILNLLRDQLTRNGHPEFIRDRIAEAIGEDMELIVNADDPLVASLPERGNEVKRFGIDASAKVEPLRAVYDDGRYCPLCGGEMRYSYRVMADFGGFECERCGFSRRECDYSVTALDLESGEIVINSDERHPLRTPLHALYSVYNTLAACAAASEAGISMESIAASVNGYFLKNGRVRQWSLGGRDVTLLTSKHENSTSYDGSLELAARRGGEVLIIVDAVSRKYFTSDTSWLYDINFDSLAADTITRVWLAGKYVNDLAARFAVSAVDKAKITALPELDDIGQALKGDAPLFCVTCFSDREKFISRLPQAAAEKKL